MLSGCYYDSKEYLFPQLNDLCDTTNITFTYSVQPILENHCYGCHSNKTYTSGSSIKLEDYNDVKIMVDNGYLLGAITHSKGYFPMPKSSPKIEDCKINVIRMWIEAGSPDN
jgi:hypothetical protein